MWRAQVDCTQTIFALTTGSLPSAVAIVKLCGPDAFAIAERIFFPKGGAKLSRTRAAVFGEIRGPHLGEKIDEALAVTFVSPQSFTGEDTIEFQVHGSIPIVRRLENLLLEEGARSAERGEFSYRALLNGKMSTSALEDLGDLFLAKDPSELQKIYGRRDGSLNAEIEKLKGQLIHLQALFDTAVDFSEEYSHVVERAHGPLMSVIRGCSEVIQRYSAFTSSGTLPRLVLAGRPNAGKSSLFNALLGRYRAIVNASPGTTRDVIEEDIEIQGKRWKLVDTAGVREAVGEAEREGIELGAEFLAASAFWILVIDGTLSISAEESRLLDQYGAKPHLIVWNKWDLAEWKLGNLSGHEVLPLSAQSGDGMAKLTDHLSRRLLELGHYDSGPLPTASQAARLRFVRDGLEEMEIALRQEVPAEYLAETNRRLMNHLSAVMGEVSVDEVLDRIFGEFCIGK